MSNFNIVPSTTGLTIQSSIDGLKIDNKDVANAHHKISEQMIGQNPVISNMDANYDFYAIQKHGESVLSVYCGTKKSFGPYMADISLTEGTQFNCIRVGLLDNIIAGNPTTNNNSGSVHRFYPYNYDVEIITNPDGALVNNNFGYDITTFGENNFIVGAPSIHNIVHVFYTDNISSYRIQTLTETYLQDNGLYGKHIVSVGDPLTPFNCLAIAEPNYSTSNRINVGRIHLYKWDGGWNRISTVDSPNLNFDHFGEMMCLDLTGGNLIVAHGNKVYIYSVPTVSYGPCELIKTISDKNNSKIISITCDNDGYNNKNALAINWEYIETDVNTGNKTNKSKVVIYALSDWSVISEIKTQDGVHGSIIRMTNEPSNSNKFVYIYDTTSQLLKKYYTDCITPFDMSSYSGIHTSQPFDSIIDIKGSTKCDVALIIPPLNESFKSITIYVKEHSVDVPTTVYPALSLIPSVNEKNINCELLEMGTTSKLPVKSLRTGGINKYLTNQHNEYHFLNFEKKQDSIDIVKYTGNSINLTTPTQIPHSLNVRPDLIMIKNCTLGDMSQWVIWHRDLPTGFVCDFSKNAPHKEHNNTTYLRPTNQYFNVYGNKNENYLGDNYVALLFANGDNFNAGFYFGGGVPVISVGFGASCVMIKNITVHSEWIFYYISPKYHDQVYMATNSYGYVKTSSVVFDQGIIRVLNSKLESNIDGHKHLYVVLNGI